MAKLMIPYGHPADPAAFEDHYASRHMPYTVEQADGDKPTSDSPPPFGRAITGRSAWHRSRTWHTHWPRRFGGGGELAKPGNRGPLTLRDGHSADSGASEQTSRVSNRDLTSALTLR
jgi:hypothetical protein